MSPISPHFSSPSSIRKSTNHPRHRELANAGLFLDTLIGEGAVGKVWACDMCIEGPSPMWRRVIAKIAIGEENGQALLNEAKVYQVLVAQNPPVGPHCYGIFQDSDRTTILILDFLGEKLESFSDNTVPRFVDSFFYL